MSAKSSSGKPSSLITMVTILRDYFFLGEQEYDGDEDSDESQLDFKTQHFPSRNQMG